MWPAPLAIWWTLRPAPSVVPGWKPCCNARRTASTSPAPAAAKTRSRSAASTAALSARQLVKP